MPGFGLQSGLLSLAVVAGFVWVLCVAVFWCLTRHGRGSAEDRRHAEQRAQHLLRELLTAQQVDQLLGIGFMEVPSRLVPGRTYHVPRRRGQVQVYERGRHAGSLCIAPITWVPEADVVLMHKLMIEADEAEYLRVANFFHPYRPS